MSIRKNFILEEDIVRHLEKIAIKKNTTQTQIIRDLIEKEYKEVSKEYKLEAIYKFAGCGNGLFEGVSIQEIKATRDV